jgi:uncharacterized protein YyaL (SSP411 family)
MPNRVLLKTNDTNDELISVSPFTEKLTPKDGKSTIYICKDFSCQQPLTSLTALKEMHL